MTIDIVVPTTGRPTLRRLLLSLAASGGPRPNAVLLVDDREQPADPLPVPVTSLRTRVLRGRARGPAAARNTGWRASTAEWIAFLDDDVEPGPDWLEQLGADLEDLPPVVVASQGRVRVPHPNGRPPTDWERSVRGLEGARFITADMAYRRQALVRLGGFDEGFRRAYREDADLALRAMDAGMCLVAGDRMVRHPVPPAGPLVSVHRQAGNADDALMLLRHGPGWRRRVEAGPGRRRRHVLITAGGLLAVGSRMTGRRRLAAVGAAVWLTGTAEFAASRIARGPRTRDEVATMAVTSVLIPPLATWHWLRGLATGIRRR